MNASPLLLSAPVMLSVCLPFQGCEGSMWGDALDSEEEQTLEYLQEPGEEDRTLEITGLTQEQLSEIAPWEALQDAHNHRTTFEYLAKEYALELCSWISDAVSFHFHAEYEELISPREYNFQTDRVFAKVSLSAIQAMFTELTCDHVGRQVFAEIIADRFTSRSGFHSFYSNDVAEWLDRPLGEYDANELGTIVQAFFMAHGVEDIDSELFDWRIGGLYEEVGRAFECGLDWEAFENNCLEQFALKQLELAR